MDFIRKSEKAFTLIEIIAVIVIIGIIILIVSIPTTKYVENSKMKTYESHTKELETATKNYMIDCLSNDEEGCFIPSKGNPVILDYDTLVDKGFSNVLEDPESEGYCDRSYVIVENPNDIGTDFNYKTCLICDKYINDPSNCKVETLTCELEVVGQQKDGWYTSGVTVNLKYSSANVVETGMNNDFDNVEYNGLTKVEIAENGIHTVYGYVKGKGSKATCHAEIKIDMSKPDGVLYMGYEVYPKENSTTVGNAVTINNLTKYGSINGIIVEFSNDLTVSSVGDIKNGNNQIKTNGSFVTGRNKAIFKVVSGTYDNLTVDFGNSEIKKLVSKIRILKQENETSVWTNKDVMLYVDGNDTITGAKEYSYDGENSYIESNTKTFSGNTTGTVLLKDAYGNISERYPYVISKIDKAIPTLNLDYLVDENSEGSLYIKQISYNASDNEMVEKIEYIEKDSKNIPIVDDNVINITTGNSKNYSNTTGNKYVFFRAIDEAGNKTDWQRSNIYIGNNLSIDEYSKVKVIKGDTYLLEVKKCNDDTCNYMEELTVTSDSFDVSTKGNGFYQISVLHESDSNLNEVLTMFKKNVYLHNFSSSTTRNRSITVNLSNNNYLHKGFSNYQNPTITTSISNSKLELEVSGDSYDNRTTSGCSQGYYNSDTDQCIYNYRNDGWNRYECKRHGTTGELRWVEIASSDYVKCPPYKKGYYCGPSISGESCSIEGDITDVSCEGWCIASYITSTKSYYQYTVGVFLK